MGWETIDWPYLTWSLLHDLAIAVYIGGAVAMEWVLAPAQSSIPPAQAQVMGQKSADRFLKLVWISLGIIIVTGLLRLDSRDMLAWGWPPFQGLMSWDFSYGRTVTAMIGIWGLLVVNGLLITFVLRPRLSGRLRPGSSAAQASADRDAKLQAARWVTYITRADLVLAVLAALLGVSLIRGGLL